MSAIWRLFDPLWEHVARHRFMWAAAFAIATVPAILLDRSFWILGLGCTAGILVMMEAEARLPEPALVHLPSPGV